MAKIVLEVTSANRMRKDLFSFEGGTVSLGRAFDNDLIVSDPYVSAHHAQISFDDKIGGWMIRDLAGENAIRIKGIRKTQSELPLVSGSDFFLGHTQIRFFTGDHDVPPAIKLPQINDLLLALGHPLSTGFLFALVNALLVWSQLMETAKELKPAGVIVGNIPFILILVVWGGLWAFVGRLIKHKASFWAQMSIGFFCFVVLFFLEWVGSYVAFYSGDFWVSLITFTGLFGVLFGFLLTENLALATYMRRRQRIMVAAILSVFIFGSVLLINKARRDEFFPRPFYAAVVRPSYLKLYQTKTVKEFIHATDRIFIYDGQK